MLLYSCFLQDNFHYSVCKFSVSIFTEDLRPCIAFNICSLQSDNHLDMSKNNPKKCKVQSHFANSHQNCEEGGACHSLLIPHQSIWSITKIYLQSCHFSLFHSCIVNVSLFLTRMSETVPTGLPVFLLVSWWSFSMSSQRNSQRTFLYS